MTAEERLKRYDRTVGGPGVVYAVAEEAIALLRRVRERRAAHEFWCKCHAAGGCDCGVNTLAVDMFRFLDGEGGGGDGV